jgi:hypothetical protein
VAKARPPLWRRLLPWAVSAAALGYVFGWATDWKQLLAAMRGANLPLFITYTTLDKLIFFAWWGVLQSAAVRRFVTPISTREVIAVRGGAELVRTVNGALADAAFLYGLARLTRGSITAVVAAAGVPFVCHFAVLLIQATLALAFLSGGAGANRDIAVAAGLGWMLVAGAVAAGRLGFWERLVGSTRLGAWMRNVDRRSLLSLAGWFALFALFDVIIQGLASRAFGVTIDWWALAGRIPILYVFLSLPSFGNFGIREIAWAACFSEFASRETLIAYALATNSIFMILHLVIGILFLPRAIALLTEVRRARRAGQLLPEPLLHDASDP